MSSTSTSTAAAARPGSLGALWRWVADRRGDLSYTFGSLLASAVAFGASILAARYVPPEEMGVVQTLLLIPTYLNFLHLGVFNGLNRNIALYAGSGDSGKVRGMVDTSWSVARLVGGVGVAVSLVLGAWFWLAGYPSLYLWGLLFVLVSLVLDPFSQHMETVFLSSRSFSLLSKALLWQNVVTGLASVLPVGFGVAGLVVSRMAGSASRFFVRWRRLPIRAEGVGTRAQARELAVTGFPLLVAGALYSYLAVADRSVVALHFGPREVGHLVLSGLVVTGLQLIPQCLATVYYPRVTAEFGRTRSAASLRPHFWRILGSTLLVLVPLCLLAYALIGPLTRRFLPQYVPGIRAAEIAALSSVAFAFTGVAGIIAAVRRNTAYIVCIGFSLALVWILGDRMVAAGQGIEGVLVARAIAMMVLCLFTLGYTYWLTAPGRARE